MPALGYINRGRRGDPSGALSSEHRGFLLPGSPGSLISHSTRGLPCGYRSWNAGTTHHALRRAQAAACAERTEAGYVSGR